jgi:hypothetical protein
MSDYKEVWRKAQDVLRKQLGKNPRSANVTKVASRLKKGNTDGAREVLSAIIEASAAAGAVAGAAAGAASAADAAGGGGGATSGTGLTGRGAAGKNDAFKEAKQWLIDYRTELGLPPNPPGPHIHSVGAIFRKQQNSSDRNAELNAYKKGYLSKINQNTEKAESKKAATASAKASAAANAKAAKAAAAANAKAAKNAGKSAAKTRKTKNSAAAVNNVLALFNNTVPVITANKKVKLSRITVKKLPKIKTD